ncbi:hypothetical protein SMC26_31825 [Actinomadura fulvescens]|uniref:Uncharacterized protein n=1 Tax=Actinomadura fulvescens TaxID=46160 RepID=A0ABP6CMF1_9ACTN
MSTTPSTTALSICDLARLLFTSRLQASDHPTAEQVRDAIDERLCAWGADCGTCLASVAQEAGDHPEAYAVRMRWALETVTRVYPHAVAVA